MDHEKPISPWQEWNIIDKIGEGSYGKVYKAQRTEQGRSFYSALKIIPIPANRGEISSVRLETDSEASLREYFKNIVDDCIQEISTMEYFRGNSHIVSVEDFKVVEYLDEIGWEIYIRMEYLQSFLDFCTGRQLTEREIIKIGIDLCKALEYCGQLSIIHRDIKPENIFVSRFGDFKLGDFGIARELERTMGSMSKKGTFSYMAPEIYRGEPYDSSVDIYSLGIVLYRLMNRNRLPFMNLEKQLITYRDKEAALNRRMSGELLPPPVDASHELAEVILRACAFDVKERYQLPELLREDLERLRRGEYIAGSPAKAVGQSAEAAGPASGNEGQAAGSGQVEKQAQGTLAGQEVSGSSRTLSGREEDLQDADLAGGLGTPKTLDVETVLEDDLFTKDGEGFRLSGRLPLWAAVLLIIGGAALLAAVIILTRKQGAPETGQGQLVSIDQAVAALENNDNSTAQIDDFSTSITNIKAQATQVTQMLPSCTETGEEGNWLHYFDDTPQLVKALIYPEQSRTGKFEEYYFWDGQLFFVYVWDEASDDPSDEPSDELYYYDAQGNMIRWIDEEGTVHDMENSNAEYASRAEQFLRTAAGQLRLAADELSQGR